MKDIKLALLVANRGFFPSTVIDGAYEDMRAAAEKAGVELLEINRSLTRYGAVETTQEGMIFAEHLEKHHGEFDGVIISMPNFGDENGIKAALKDVTVPVLIQAYPDEIGKMDFANRRDAFCGKLGLCAVFKQMGFKFTSGMPFVMNPLSEDFARELKDFIAICRVVKGMRHARIGIFGARTTAFKSVRFDESALERLGVDTECYDLSALFERVKTISPDSDDVRFFEQKLTETGNFCDIPDYAKTALPLLGAALKAYVDEDHLDALAIRCWSELQHEYKIAPCALLGIFNQLGIPAACETDGSNVIPMLALSLASNSPAGCLDINNNYGTESDKCILFHCGPLAADLMVGGRGQLEEHKMFVKTQGENCSWGVNVGRLRPGVITLSGCRTENGEVRFFVEKAEITDDIVEPAFFGTPGVMKVEGLQKKLYEMANEGFRHHAIITEGDCVRVIDEALTKYLGYTKVLL